MPQDYNFTFQNLNPMNNSGWTGNTIVNSSANQAIYNSPFDLVDPQQAVQDKTASDPTGSGTTTAANLKDAQGLLQRNTQLLANLTRNARNAQSADMLTQANTEIAAAQKEQDRLQAQVNQFKATTKTPQQLQAEAAKATQDAALKAQVAKQVENQHKLQAAQQQKVDAQAHSVDALKASIAGTQDPKVIEHLNKQLATEQTKFTNLNTQLTARTSIVTKLQDRLTSLNTPAPAPPGTPAPSTTPPPAGTTTPPPATGTPTAPKPMNYWDELVDKHLGSRMGASGWHSGAAPTTTVPTVVPTTVPPVAPGVPVPPVVTPPATPTTPVAPVVTAPALLTPPAKKYYSGFGGVQVPISTSGWA